MSYETEELVSSSVIARNFSSYLSRVSSHELDKVAILKNNEIKGVLISPEMYELFEDFLENFEIQNNSVKLQREIQASADSGLSDLVI